MLLAKGMLLLALQSHWCCLQCHQWIGRFGARQGGGKIAVIVVVIIINGELSTLSTVNCIIESSWVVGAGVGIDGGWVPSSFGH